MKKLIFLLALTLAGSACSKQQKEKLSPSASPATAPATGPFSDSELQSFAALDPIDTHTHVFQSAPALYALLQKLHLHILDICVDDDHSAFQKNLPLEIKDALEVVRASNSHAALCTTFDPFKFKDRGFA